MTISGSDIRLARRMIEGRVVQTPCLHARTISEISGATVFVKFENHQFTASFKDRGALVKLLSLNEEERANGVIAMSAGNHAQAVAYHSSQLNISSTIVMPEGSAMVKVRNTRRFGAEVVLSGETVDDAGQTARAIAERNGQTFVHPYDDESIMAGQGTIALEMLESVPDLDVLIVPIGGGGLIAGIATAARSVSPDIEVVGVEATMFPVMYQQLQGLDIKAGGRTIADGIAIKTPGIKTIPIVRDLVSEIFLVTEEQLERAIQVYIEIEKTVAEGGGAASLACLLGFSERFRGKKVGLVLSGGNIESRVLSTIVEHGLVRDGRMVRLRIQILDSPGVLANVASVIGDCGANIIEVSHQRAFSLLSARLANLDVSLETMGVEHVTEIVGKLQASGYDVEVMDAKELKE